jgi:type IV pilus assembly protein PilA
VAIPTYLSARNRAENRAAQVTLQHVFVAVKAAYASQNDFSTFPGGFTGMTAYLNHDDPGITVNPAGAVVKAINEVAVLHSPQSIFMADWAPDGKCWYLLDIESAGSSAISTTGVSGPGTYYGAGPTTNSGSCRAAFVAPPSGWQPSFAAASANA